MYTLYFAPDNASLVVRIVLEEIGANYNTWLVDHRSNEQSSEAYRKLNPSGLIPVCIIDGKPVFETAAILLTLADRHRVMAPSPESSDRPQFLKWLFFISNTLHADLRLLFYPKTYIGPDDEHMRVHAAVTRDRLRKHFEILEVHYSGLESPYLFGNEPTVADIYAALCLRWPQLYPVDEPAAFNSSDYPALRALLLALEVRPAFKRSFEAEGIPAPYLSDAQHSDGSAGSPL